MGIRAAWESSLRAKVTFVIRRRRTVVERLENLQQTLASHGIKRRPGLARIAARRAVSVPVKGLYIWGGVGRGKTFLMDLFFETLRSREAPHSLPPDDARRARAPAALGDIEDPLDKVAADIAATSGCSASTSSSSATSATR